MKNIFLCLTFLLALNSCGPTRNLTYFSDLKSVGEYTEKITNKIDPKIQADDLLAITVSSLNSESNILFNNGAIQSSGSGSSSTSTGKTSEGYLVGADGTINFPILGSVKLAGLTKEEATNKMTAEIKVHVKNPIVNIRYLNFKITVVGEVNRPSTFTVPTERISVVEALGLAGDMTAYGKRENVLLIREKDGVRSAIRIDLNNKEVLSPPYFYLQQNDVLYVEPIRVRTLQGSASAFYIPIISIAISVLTLIVLGSR